MAAICKVYGLAQQSMLSEEIDFVNETVKVMLATSAYTVNQDTDRYRSAVTNEVVGTGYTADGLTLTSKTVSYDTATNVLKLSCANLSWPASSITARYAVFYIDTGDASSDPLLCYWDFGADVTSVGGPFDLTVNAAGLVTLTAA